LLRHDCTQNHHMLGCIVPKTSLSCVLLVIETQQTTNVKK